MQLATSNQNQEQGNRKEGSAKRAVALNDDGVKGARECVEWITEAKTEATRARRVASAVEWMEKGKSRNWKYGKGATS